MGIGRGSSVLLEKALQMIDVVLMLMNTYCVRHNNSCMKLA